MISILIADDHAIIRRGLIQILSEIHDMQVTDEAIHADEVLDKVSAHDYDILLLDISMPGKSGLDIIHAVKIRKPGIPVLMLSVHPEEQYAIRALKEGASGYLTKNSAVAELITAIRKIVKGGRYVSSSLAERLVTEMKVHDEKPCHEKLSNREYQVMCMCASGKNVKTIATELSLSMQTVSTYRKRILEKMGMSTINEVIRYALNKGLVE